MPDGDTILIIWVKLLILAGKVNDTGYVYLSDAIPYTDEMLATIFRRPLTTVRLALQTFEKFGMIETASKGILIVNWEKHQNVDGMERIKELTRNRVQKHRQKQLTEGVTQPGNVTVTLPVTLRNATDIDIDIKNKNKENIEKKVYGELQNVFLSPSEYQKLKTAYGESNTLKYIENLSLYIAQKGKDPYKSHYATLRNWLNRDGIAKDTAIESKSYDPEWYD
jgi:predicted phage replisome organizer